MKKLTGKEKLFHFPTAKKRSIIKTVFMLIFSCALFLCNENDFVLISLSSQGYNLLISGLRIIKYQKKNLINTAMNKVSQEKLIDD